MISTVLAFALAGAGMQSDTTRAQRDAFNACLRAYMQHSIDAHMTMDAFSAALPQQCTTEEAAYRAAIIQRETAMHASRADAQQSATDEIQDSRTNFHDRFEIATTPAAPH
jgi:hypothetical protein